MTITNLIYSLLGISITDTHFHPERSLPLTQWRQQLNQYEPNSKQSERVLQLLDGTIPDPSNELEELSAYALYKIRTASLIPREMFLYHFRLYNLLHAADAHFFTGSIFHDFISPKWAHIAQNEPYNISHPKLYIDPILEACRDNTSRGLRKASKILMAVAPAIGVTLARESVAMLLSDINNNTAP
jgi:hypothetical protein